MSELFCTFGFAKGKKNLQKFELPYLERKSGAYHFSWNVMEKYSSVPSIGCFVNWKSSEKKFDRIVLQILIELRQ